MKWNKLKTASLRRTVPWLILPYLSLFYLLMGCASLGGDEELELKENIVFKPNHNYKHYVFKTGYRGVDQKVAYAMWSLCHNPRQEAVYILIGEIPIESQHQELCLSKLAQPFLNGPYSVLLLPNSSMTVGSPAENWLQQQIKATEAVLASYASKDMLQPQSRKGFWFSESHTILGGVLAKNIQKKEPKSLLKIIFEQGMYDLNYVLEHSSSQTIKEQLGQLEKIEPEAIDNYSLAYDFEDLPQSIFLYHAEKNSEIPIKQAEDFATALQSSNFSVRFVKIPELADKISEDIRLQILRKAISTP